MNEEHEPDESGDEWDELEGATFLALQGKGEEELRAMVADLATKVQKLQARLAALSPEDADVEAETTKLPASGAALADDVALALEAGDLAATAELCKLAARAAVMKERGKLFLKIVSDAYADLEERILARFTEEGTESHTCFGRTIYPSRTIWAGTPHVHTEEAKRVAHEALVAALEAEESTAHLVAKTFNVQSLSAFVRAELPRDETDTPFVPEGSPLAGKLRISPVWKIKTTKSRSKGAARKALK